MFRNVGKRPGPKNKKFYQMLPRVGFVWPRGDFMYWDAVEFQDAFEEVCPASTKSKQQFDMMLAGLIIGPLREATDDLYDLQPMNFWVQAQARGLSTILSASHMDVEAAYRFVFKAVKARRAFHKRQRGQPQILKEGWLARAVDRLISHFQAAPIHFETYLGYYVRPDLKFYGPYDYRNILVRRDWQRRCVEGKNAAPSVPLEPMPLPQIMNGIWPRPIPYMEDLQCDAIGDGIILAKPGDMLSF